MSKNHSIPKALRHCLKEILGEEKAEQITLAELAETDLQKVSGGKDGGSNSGGWKSNAYSYKF